MSCVKDIPDAVARIWDWIVDKCKSFTERHIRLDNELISACKALDLEGARYALQRGANINAKDAEGRPVLLIASSKGENKSVNKQNFHLVNLLLEYKPDVNARDHYRNTALIMAARNGNRRIVEELITAGADVNAENTEGFTAIMRAKEHEYYETVQVLRNHGARE